MSTIQLVPVTGSTNTDLLALARDGAAEATWLRAERQTGGRGRQGRTWESPPGNLHASTLVRLHRSDPPAPTLALVAAVALHEAATGFGRLDESGSPSPFRRFAPPSLSRREREGARSAQPSGKGEGELMLKWPNDLLAGPAKLAGILLERAGDAVVIGFGVNLAHAPAGLDRPAASLAALTGTAPDPAACLESLAAAFARTLAEWRAGGGGGLAAIRVRWLAAAHPIGAPLFTPAGEGLFDGLDETGALRLRLADGTVRVIHAGDVFLV